MSDPTLREALEKLCVESTTWVAPEAWADPDNPGKYITSSPQEAKSFLWGVAQYRRAIQRRILARHPSEAPAADLRRAYIEGWECGWLRNAYHNPYWATEREVAIREAALRHPAEAYTAAGLRRAYKAGANKALGGNFFESELDDWAWEEYPDPKEEAK